MKIKEREEYRDRVINNVYKNSWTFARLTSDEQSKILDILYNLKVFSNRYKDIAYEIHSVYCAFLQALGYQPIGWRE